MKLSKKKSDALYSSVHEDIFQARIKVAKLLNDLPLLGSEVDNVLSDLMNYAPQNALNVFEK